MSELDQATDAVWQAVLSFPHSITGEEIVIGYSSDQDGHNAAAQLNARIRKALASQALRSQGEAVAWLHKPTGNVFKDGECQALIKVWQRQFTDIAADEIAADFVPLFTHPAPQEAGDVKVTDAMVERACVISWHGVASWDAAVNIAASEPSSSCAIAVAGHRKSVRAIITAALQAIADLPTGKNEDVMEGQEQAYRAIEALQ